MKRILSLALVAVMLLMSALCVSAADTCEVTLTVTGDTGKAGDVITVETTVDGVATLFGFQVDIMYDNSKVVLWNAATGEQVKIKSDGVTYTDANAKKALVYTDSEATFDGVAYEGDYEDGKIWGQYIVKCNGEFYSYSLSAAGSESDSLPAIIADGYNPMTMTFVRVADGTAGDTGIAFATNNAGNPDGCIVSPTSTSGAIVTKTLDYKVAPVVEPDKFINDEGATGGVATLTFYGRVGADWLDQDYGVIVEGKDFYGAKDGDIVSDGAEGTKTFNFDAWDGNFEIILTNITVKGTAGTKTYQFFVGENVTEEATVVVE